MAAASYVRSKRVKIALWTAGIVLLLSQVLAFAYTQFLRERAIWLANANAETLLVAARRDPEDSEVIYTAAFRLWQNGQPAAALPMAEKAAAQAPDRAINQLLVGYLYAQDRRPAEALRKYLEALRLDPKLEAAHSSTAQIYLRAGLEEDAIPHLKAAINPRRPDAASNGNLAQAYFQHKDYAQAEAKCRELMPYLPPHDIRGYRMLYRIKRAQGRGRELEPEMLAFWKKNPFLPRADFYGYLAYVVLDSSRGRRLAEAEQIAERGVKKRPAMGEAFEAMGMVRLHQGRTAEAIWALRRALSMEPRLFRARVMLAEALKRAGRPQEARKFEVPQPTPGIEALAQPLARRLENEPGNGKLRLQLAELLERGGDPARAFRVCRPAVLEKVPDAALLSRANQCLDKALALPVEEW